MKCETKVTVININYFGPVVPSTKAKAKPLFTLESVGGLKVQKKIYRQADLC